MSWTRVAGIGELPPERGLQVETQGREVALFRVGEAVYAVDNVCPHRGGPIAEGELKGATVTCPWHAWTFDLETGLCTFNPRAGLECFEVKVEGADVYIRHLSESRMANSEPRS